MVALFIECSSAAIPRCKYLASSPFLLPPSPDAASSGSGYELTQSEETISSLEKSGHLPNGWKESLPSSKIEMLVIRPALLMGDNEKSVCEEKGFGGIRVGPEDIKGQWSVGRKDVAWFIAKKGVKEWNDWKGKAVTVSY